MLVLAIILFGMVVGAGAQLILGRSRGRIDWTMAIVAGLVGSFIGGLLISLLSGDGLDLKPSGIIGSLAGAILVTAGWRWWDSRNKPTAADRAAKRSGDPRKSHPADPAAVLAARGNSARGRGRAVQSWRCAQGRSLPARGR
jgi:uncharacterized membrane protein YeaQ/YmgE (transglycosylase-associated protein family)